MRCFLNIDEQVMLKITILQENCEPKLAEQHVSYKTRKLEGKSYNTDKKMYINVSRP